MTVVAGSGFLYDFDDALMLYLQTNSDDDDDDNELLSDLSKLTQITYRRQGTACTPATSQER